jgi:hypothetical protein
MEEFGIGNLELGIWNGGGRMMSDEWGNRVESAVIPVQWRILNPCNRCNPYKSVIQKAKNPCNWCNPLNPWYKIGQRPTAHGQRPTVNGQRSSNLCHRPTIILSINLISPKKAAANTTSGCSPSQLCNSSKLSAWAIST